jgi:hypothetical protein
MNFPLKYVTTFKTLSVCLETQMKLLDDRCIYIAYLIYLLYIKKENYLQNKIFFLKNILN